MKKFFFILNKLKQSKTDFLISASILINYFNKTQNFKHFFFKLCNNFSTLFSIKFINIIRQQCMKLKGLLFTLKM